jgi:hypothetical protein
MEGQTIQWLNDKRRKDKNEPQNNKLKDTLKSVVRPRMSHYRQHPQMSGVQHLIFS